MTDRRTNDRFRNRFRRPRDGRTGRHTAHETDAHDAEEDPNSEAEESCEEESELTAAFELEMDELASVVEELEDTLDVQDVEDLRELSESMYEGLATIRETHAQLRENEESRLPAFLVCLFSCSFRFATCLFERHWPREKKGFDCNPFRHCSGDPICPAKDKHDAQAHITSCTLEAVHVH